MRWQPGGFVAATTGLQVASRLLSIVGANALLRIAPGTNPLPVGGWVDAMLVGPLLGMPRPAAITPLGPRA